MAGYMGYIVYDGHFVFAETRFWAIVKALDHIRRSCPTHTDYDVTKLPEEVWEDYECNKDNYELWHDLRNSKHFS